MRIPFAKIMWLRSTGSGHLPTNWCPLSWMVQTWQHLHHSTPTLMSRILTHQGYNNDHWSTNIWQKTQCLLITSLLIFSKELAPFRKQNNCMYGHWLCSWKSCNHFSPVGFGSQTPWDCQWPQWIHVLLLVASTLQNSWQDIAVVQPLSIASRWNFSATDKSEYFFSWSHTYSMATNWWQNRCSS